MTDIAPMPDPRQGHEILHAHLQAAVREHRRRDGVPCYNRQLREAISYRQSLIIVSILPCPVPATMDVSYTCRRENYWGRLC